MAALRALIEVTAQSGCATALDGAEHFQVQPRQPASVFLDEALARLANDIGHLQGRPAHLRWRFRERFTPSGLETSIASSGLGTACK
jgi:hypothetical protein